MDKLQIIKRNFFKDTKLQDFEKKYLINSNNTMCIDNDSYESQTGVYFETTFKKIANTLQISIELLAWSNTEQKYLPLEQSVWADTFYDGKYLSQILQSHIVLAQKLLDVFDSFKYYWELKELFYRFENPTIIYHYKLLNTFSKDELDFLSTKFDYSSPILNSLLLKSNLLINRFDKHLFLPFYTNGYYFCGNDIEISVDLNAKDVATISIDGKNVSKEEFFKALKP